MVRLIIGNNGTQLLCADCKKPVKINAIKKIDETTTMVSLIPCDCKSMEKKREIAIQQEKRLD